MKGTTALWILVALAFAPAASAGSASSPEVVDESGDKVSSIPGLGANSIDINKAWIDQETPDAFVFILDVAGSFNPDPTETLDYEWVVSVDGTEYEFGAEVWDQGATTTTTPSGLASEASHNGAGLMTIVVPRTAFTDIAPGQRMDVVSVTAQAYVVSALIWNDSDDAVGERAYTIGAQADPSMDFDGDGHPDREEIAAGTDPTDPEDPPAFIPPTTENSLTEMGGTFALQAPSPVTDAFDAAWKSTLDAPNVTLDVEWTQGRILVTLDDEFGNEAVTEVQEGGTFTLDAAGLLAGNWTLVVATTDFAGTATLHVAAAADEASVTDEDADPVDDDDAPAPVDSGSDDEGEPTGKKTPAPFLAPLALAGAALMRRRP